MYYKLHTKELEYFLKVKPISGKQVHLLYFLAQLGIDDLPILRYLENILHSTSVSRFRIWKTLELISKSHSALGFKGESSTIMEKQH